jgi:hypothetical protein
VAAGQRIADQQVVAAQRILHVGHRRQVLRCRGKQGR